MDANGTAAFGGILAIGISLGLLFCVLLDNLALALPLGVGLGAVVGWLAARGAKSRKGQDDSDAER